MLSILENLVFEDGGALDTIQQITQLGKDVESDGSSAVFDKMSSPSTPSETAGWVFNKTASPDGSNNYSLFDMRKSHTIGDDTVGATITRDDYGNVSMNTHTPLGNTNHTVDASSSHNLVDQAKFGINRAVNYTAHNPGTVAAGVAGAAALGYGAYRGIKGLNQRPNQQLNQRQRY